MSESERRVLLCIALAYVFAVAVGIESINSAWGNLLPIPLNEFFSEGSGYGKLRGQRGEFQNILGIFGIWVYPLCVYGIVGCVRQIRLTRSRAEKLTFGACAFMCFVILARFCFLGVFTVGTGF